MQIRRDQQRRVDKVTHGKQALFGKKNQECYRCGGDHEPSTCKFKDAKCYSCQKKGHTAKKMSKS